MKQYKREDLQKMRVADIKMLIRKHNLHNAIRNYSRLRKADLIEAFLKVRRAPTDTDKDNINRKRRVALTTGTISKGNISGAADKRFKNDYLDKLEAKARKMDASKRGKKLVSDKPVSKSREPKTVNDYRRGKNYV